MSLLILLGCAWFAVAVHEAGHLLAGRLMGFRFGFFALGPVWLAREGARIRARWNRLPAAWGGMALSYPTDTRSLESRLAFYAAGGPLASFTSAALALWLANAFPHDAFVHGAGTALAIISTAVLIATAQPFGTGVGLPSDGGRILRFLAKRNEAEAEAAVVALGGLAAAGVRPREWDPGLIRIVGTIRTPAATALAARTLIFRYRLDQGDRPQADAAADLLREIYDSAPRLLRGDAASELAFFLSFFRRDVVGAENFMKDARGALTERHRIFRAEAAVLLRSGDISGARHSLDKARRALERPLVEVTDLDRDLVAAVAQEVGRATPP